jgi:glycosyltransferase involved in cell wall biosynthesis
MTVHLIASEQTEKPLVSVIMNCLNSEMYLREAIDSVFAQTYPNWEIIFWDNASADGSSAIAQSYQDGRLRYFRGDRTVPLGHARNLAIEQSRGEFIAFLDCDDLWLPEKLEKQLPLFFADEEVGLVYSDTYFFNESGAQKRLYSRRTPYRGHRFEDLLNKYLISLETVVLRRSALDSLSHWFDEKFNFIEEYDLFVRIGITWKIDYVPYVLAKWRVHGESWSWRDPDSFTDEGMEMLNKLRKDSNVCLAHGEALLAAENRIHLKQALREWKKENSAAARLIIRKIPARGLMLVILWFASFFPYGLIEGIYRFLNGTITPVKK